MIHKRDLFIYMEEKESERVQLQNIRQNTLLSVGSLTKVHIMWKFRIEIQAKELFQRYVRN